MGKLNAFVRILGIVAVTSGCSKFQNFDFYSLPATDGELQSVPTCSANGSETLQVPLKTSGGSLRVSNVVFVIDTSGSMSNEIDQVRANMDLFVTSVKSTLPEASTKFMVIGDKLSGKEVLPAGYVHNGTYNDVYWHYDNIQSTDKMAKLMRAYGMTTFTSGAQTINIGGTFPAIPNANIQGPCSSNGPLFNCSALNHVVIVTDDIEALPKVQTQDQVQAAFLGSFGAWLAKNKNGFRLHAIHGKTTSTCSIAKVGTIYENISAATGSLSLDVCASDWSPLFTALKDTIVASSGAVGFGSCASATRKIVSVHVQWGGGDVALAPADFVYTNAAGANLQASIYISPQTLQSKGVPTDGTPLTLVIDTTF